MRFLDKEIIEGIEEYFEEIKDKMSTQKAALQFEREELENMRKRKEQIQNFVKEHLAKNHPEICDKCRKNKCNLIYSYECGYAGLKLNDTIFNSHESKLKIETIGRYWEGNHYLSISDEELKTISVIF